MVEINKASKENIPEIVKIHKSCVLETNSKIYPKEVITEWLEQITDKNVIEQFTNTDWYVIKLNNQIIGFSQISFPEKELYQINIPPLFQNQGFGKRLYSFVEELFKSRGVGQIGLNATLNAVKFYESLGFKKVKNISFKLDKESVEMVKMTKNLPL
jgi:ribosomal protein S18 acetylase RimI-like enzyme